MIPRGSGYRPWSGGHAGCTGLGDCGCACRCTRGGDGGISGCCCFTSVLRDEWIGRFGRMGGVTSKKEHKSSTPSHNPPGYHYTPTASTSSTPAPGCPSVAATPRWMTPPTAGVTPGAWAASLPSRQHFSVLMEAVCRASAVWAVVFLLSVEGLLEVVEHRPRMSQRRRGRPGNLGPRQSRHP